MSARSLTPSRRLHRVLLRTTGVAPRAWQAVFGLLARLYGAHLVRGLGQSAVYVRGSHGAGDAVPALSDIDLAVVVGPGERDRVRRRWRRARRLLGDQLFDWPLVLEPNDLRECGVPTHIHGLNGRGGALYWGPAAAEERMWLSERPELYAPTGGWRLVRGRDLQPHAGPRSGPERGQAAWLLLQQLWRLLIPVCLDPSGPRSARLCWKLYVEPARIWLWLARGERFDQRAPALRRLAEVLPDEAASMAVAEALGEQLHRSPRPPLDDAMHYLVRMCEHIARLLAEEADAAGSVEVELDWAGPSELVTPLVAHKGDKRPAAPLPLVDWRALVISRLPDEIFATHPGDPADQATVAAVAETVGQAGAYRMLRSGSIAVLPSRADQRLRLRALQCPVSDPVTFALCDGRKSAAFPDLPGWSVRDWARRAVAEHRAALGEPHPENHSGHELARLIGAARAALLLESVEAGQPVLRLTVAATLRALAERGNGAASAALESYADFARDWRQVPDSVVVELRRLVVALPGYADDSGGARLSSSAAGSSRS